MMSINGASIKLRLSWSIRSLASLNSRRQMRFLSWAVNFRKNCALTIGNLDSGITEDLGLTRSYGTRTAEIFTRDFGFSMKM